MKGVRSRAPNCGGPLEDRSSLKPQAVVPEQDSRTGVTRGCTALGLESCCPIISQRQVLTPNEDLDD